ncbi:MAG TPA: hypothetical protein VGC47_15430 [Acidimicrobiia bacterium]
MIEAREGQDERDRAAIYRALGSDPNPPLTYSHHTPTNEPLLWVPDAVAWAWGRGGSWRRWIQDLGMVRSVEVVGVD